MVDYIVSQGYIYRRGAGGTIEYKYLLDFCDLYRIGINDSWKMCENVPESVKKALYL